MSPATDREPHADGGEAYLYVENADVLFEEWGRPGIAGRTRPPGDTPYQLREGSHVDPDGNLIRFGSPLPQLRRAWPGSISFSPGTGSTSTSSPKRWPECRRSPGPDR
jgi:hypothetical protein